MAKELEKAVPWKKYPDDAIVINGNAELETTSGKTAVDVARRNTLPIWMYGKDGQGYRVICENLTTGEKYVGCTGVFTATEPGTMGGLLMYVRIHPNLVPETDPALDGGA